MATDGQRKTLRNETRQKRNSICHMTIYVSAFSLRKHFHMQILMTFTFTYRAKKH